MKVRMVLVVMACLLLATACGSSEPELDMSQAAIAERVEAFVKTATTTVKSATTTVASMSRAEAYCSDLGKGMSPLQIWGGVKDDWPDVEKFAYRAYVWVKSECPSELKSNELLRYWFENWDINPDS